MKCVLFDQFSVQRRRRGKIDAIFVQCVWNEWAEERQERARPWLFRTGEYVMGETHRSESRVDENPIANTSDMVTGKIASRMFFSSFVNFFFFVTRRKEFEVVTKAASAQVTILILHFRFGTKLNTHRKGRNGVEPLVVRLSWSIRNWVETGRLIDIEKFMWIRVSSCCKRIFSTQNYSIHIFIKQQKTTSTKTPCVGEKRRRRKKANLFESRSPVKKNDERTRIDRSSQF